MKWPKRAVLAAVLVVSMLAAPAAQAALAMAGAQELLCAWAPTPDTVAYTPAQEGQCPPGTIPVCAAELDDLLADAAICFPPMDPPVAEPPAQSVRSFTLINRTPHPIGAVYVVEAGQAGVAGWGESLLPEGAIVAAGGGEAVIPLDRFAEGTCQFDVRFVSVDGRQGTFADADLCAVTTLVVQGA